MWRWLALAAATLVAGCSREPDNEQRLARVEAATRQHQDDVEAVAAQATRLGQRWSDIAHDFQLAAANYQKSQTQLAQATQIYAASSSELAAASEVAARAATKWRLFQKLVVIAATVDAANLDSARSAAAQGTSRVDCGENLTTAAYRALLVSQGVDLAGKDIDHIVPRSLGGADNPGNYRVISAHENRSLGATWNEEKCLAVGESRCARAVATSHECGSLRGIGF